MYSLEEALAYWNDTGRYGTAAERVIRSRRWQPYYSYIAKRSMGQPYKVNKQSFRIVNFMSREKILDHNDTLLDIGAGMGSYSIEFARLCASVTALDMNNDCLLVLKDKAARCGLSNIRCVNAPWEEYQERKRFDVTFSAMCPAICDQEELFRMEALTKRAACLLTVTRGSYESCRRELMRQLSLKKLDGMVTEALHYYNVLYLMGRQPNVKCWSEHFVTSASAESMIDRYTIYLKVFGIEESESVPFLRDFFAKRSVNGMIQDECQMNYALIFWDVPNDERRSVDT